MDTIIAMMEVHKFIGKVMGVDTERELFAPSLFSMDLLRMEHWMVSNNVAYTVAWLPFLYTEGVFEVSMGGDGYEDYVRVIHEDRAVAFCTAFAILHGDVEAGFVRCYDDIEYLTVEREDEDV